MADDEIVRAPPSLKDSPLLLSSTRPRTHTHPLPAQAPTHPLGLTWDLLCELSHDLRKKSAAATSVLPEKALLKRVTSAHACISGQTLTFVFSATGHCKRLAVTCRSRPKSSAYTDWFKPHEGSRRQVLF